MTMTDRTTEMLALADRIAAWSPEKHVPMTFIARERRMIVTALRASACAYVAGQRDMQERAKAVAHGEIEQCTSHFGRVMAKRLSGSIASLPLHGALAATPEEIAASKTLIGPSDTPTSGDAEPTFGCKRAGGFVDSNCLALCNCDTTMRLAALKPEAAPVGEPSADENERQFNDWYAKNFLDPDGNDTGNPGWLKDDLRLAWGEAITTLGRTARDS